MKNFYKKFQIITGLPLWRNYLRWVYRKAVEDPSCFHITPIAKRLNPLILLCGVSGEITADEFIGFVLKTKRNSQITIIDIGNDQVESVRRLVSDKYQGVNITIRQANALNLDFIKDKSVDWIDTDGFFSYFDEKQLLLLFREWKRMLRDDGFITFRELVSHNSITSAANNLRDRASRMYMGIPLHLHSLSELTAYLDKLEFHYSKGCSPIPFLNRFCLVKNKSL